MTVWRVGGEAPGTVATVRQGGGKAMCPRGISEGDWLGAIGRFGPWRLGQPLFSGLLENLFITANLNNPLQIAPPVIWPRDGGKLSNRHFFAVEDNLEQGLSPL